MTTVLETSFAEINRASPVGESAAENWHRFALPAARALLAPLETTTDPAPQHAPIECPPANPGDVATAFAVGATSVRRPFPSFFQRRLGCRR